MEIENPIHVDVMHVIDIEIPNAKEIPETSAMPIIRCVEESVERERERERESIEERYSNEGRDLTSTGKIYKLGKKICFWAEITLIALFGLSFLCGFILFFVWLYNPNIFGSTPETY
jgi:cytochrome b subunit of formate dehydrogenase